MRSVFKRPHFQPRTSRYFSATSVVGRWEGWCPVIGLELHVQLKSPVKLFSSAPLTYDAQPNTFTAPFDAALPGSLPSLQLEPVKLAVAVCLALKATINRSSTFERKHYFYPDLPSGFQITQRYSPIAKDGQLTVRPNLASDDTVNVRIEQVQLEQDTAKSAHDQDSNKTFIDLNRSGAALVEIVTRPDMKSPEEASAFVRQLQSLLRYIGASDGNMFKGELRCDANVSIYNAKNPNIKSARCEVKNISGIKHLAHAIEYEIQRHVSTLEKGESIQQETRGFDSEANETFHLRKKEDAPDYRYIPDPELGPLNLSQALISNIESELPELPEAAFQRLQSDYGLKPRDASVIISLGEDIENDELHPGIGLHYYLSLVHGGRNPIHSANWFIHELLGQLGKLDLPFSESIVPASDLGILIDAVADESLTGPKAKAILATFLSQTSRGKPSMKLLVDQEKANNISEETLEKLCYQVVAQSGPQVEKIKKGNRKAIMSLVGQVMKLSKGKADPKQTFAILDSLL